MKVLIAGVLSLVVLAGGIGLLLAWDAAETTTAAIDPPPGAAGEGGYVRVTTTTTTTRATTGSAAVAPPTPVVPPCTQAEEPVQADPLHDWATVVVDTARKLDPAFTPPDLVPVSRAGFEGNEADMVRALVIDDLRALREAAEANGTPFYVVSGFRSYDYQQNLFDTQVAQDGLEAATSLTARPGHSEHQLGTTIDVLDPGSEELTTDFGATPAGQWIAAHAPEFGFVVSYPADSHAQTCYDFEPWHLRYVGRDMAGQVQRSGQTPREYLLTRAAPTSRPAVP